MFVMAEVDIVQSAKDEKPFLRVKLAPDGPTIDISTNLAEMIGDIGLGARKRFEEWQEAETGKK